MHRRGDAEMRDAETQRCTNAPDVSRRCQQKMQDTLDCRERYRSRLIERDREGERD